MNLRIYIIFMIDSTYIPKNRADVILQEVDGESLILDNNTQEIHQLNDTATFIWQRCTGNNSIANIISQVIKNYDISDDSARADVLGVISNLKDLKLLDE